jgi:ABC-type taurine transport system ATPase subunit
LSGGIRQRVSCALSFDPALLLMDEPFAGRNRPRSSQRAAAATLGQDRKNGPVRNPLFEAVFLSARL